MAAWRRADVDEIERFTGQQILNAIVPPPVGTRLEKRFPPRRRPRRSPQRSSHRRGTASRASDPFAATLPKPMNAPFSTRFPPQSSPKRRAMAANDWSRISTAAQRLVLGDDERRVDANDVRIGHGDEAALQRLMEQARVMVLSSGALVLRSATISTPIISPRPRTSPMNGYLS